jgi:hypothetical protein
MSVGIEHRSIDTVLQAYLDYDKANFSIWAGKQLRVKYEGGNIDQGVQELNRVSQWYCIGRHSNDLYAAGL